MIFLVVAGYVSLLGLAHWRAGWRGVAGVAAAAALLLVAVGTREWARPHQDVMSFRRWDWACHATGGLPSLVLFAAAIGATLSRRRLRDADLGTQIGVAWVVGALVAALALVAELQWGIMVLSCDAL